MMSKLQRRCRVSTSVASSRHSPYQHQDVILMSRSTGSLAPPEYSVRHGGDRVQERESYPDPTF
jgi:hypothetical protein